MKRNFSNIVYPVALSLMVGAGTAAAQQQGQPGVDPLDQVTAVEVEDLVFMREEEKLARDTYLVLGEEWGLRVFSNIAKSEQKHMDALEVLLDVFGIEDPVIEEDTIGNFTDPDLQLLFEDLTTEGLKSDMDALKVGGAIEEIDILDIQEAIANAENLDVIATYENLLCGSRNHLRAFVKQIELFGEDYVPYSTMGEQEFSAIVDSPTERGCGSRRQGTGNANGAGSGKGNGNGNGNDTGNGNGAGNGNGTGNGSGAGNGNGAGNCSTTCDGTGTCDGSGDGTCDQGNTGVSG